MGRLLVAVVVVGLVGGCSPTGSEGRPERIRLQGQIEFTFSPDCEEPGRRLTWYDGQNNVIGTVTTERQELATGGDAAGGDEPGLCRLIDSFELTLPRTKFYRLEVEGIEVHPEPWSYQELAAMDFQVELTIEEAD